jgi:peptidoglycan/xylan/chitin deacetylase (PgdA/CDA1 family)
VRHKRRDDLELHNLIRFTKNRLHKLLPTSLLPPVLLYHRIALTSPAEDPSRLGVSAKRFASHMKLLHDKGLKTVTPDDIIKNTSDGETGNVKNVAITFDDGYLDNYSQAFPILREYGFRATIFLVTDLAGKMNIWDKPPYVKLMGWSQVKEMAEYGISFQSHTRTHPNLQTLDDGAVMSELLGSRHKLEDILGFPVRHLAYPYGRFDQRVIRLAGMAGYRSGWAAGHAAGSEFAMERMQVTSGDNNLRFAIKARGWASLFRRLKNFRI